MSPTMDDIFLALAYSMTVLMVGLGATGLVLAASKSVSSAVIRLVAWIYLGWSVAFTVTAYHFQVPPPIISGLVIVASLIVAIIPAGKEKEVATSASA